MKRAHHQPTPALVPARSERRRGHRVVPPDRIQCELKGRGATLRLKDISASGIALWSSGALAIGRDYDLVITLDHFTLGRRARVIHCMRDGRNWLVGLKFLENDGLVDELIKLMATEFRPQ